MENLSSAVKKSDIMAYSRDNSLSQAVPGTANLANKVIGRCYG